MGNEQSKERVALVIGNSSYRVGALENPVNDARDIAELLRQAGFQVDLRLDTTKMQLFESLQDFGERLKDKRTKFGVFYYAGHGAQQSWRNYLIPVDANVQSDDDVAQMAVDVSELTTEMARARDRNFLLIPDACRDDPFGSSYRPSTKGLSQYDAPSGSLLAYATGPGRVASDGAGRNGLYTTFLLRELSIKGARVKDAFKRVRLGVRLASRGRQIPWENTSLEEDLYIFPPSRIANLTAAEREALLDREIDAWRTAKSANSIESLAAFLREFPSGNASELAQSRLNALLRMQAPHPRLAQLHVSETPREPSTEKILVAAAPASLPVMRAVEEALAMPIAAAPPPPVEPRLAPVAAPGPESKPTVSAQVKPESQSSQLVVVAAPQPEALATTAPPTAAPSPASAPAIAVARPIEAPATVPAAPTVIAAMEVPQDLDVAATPMYQGSYEYARRFQVGDVFTYRVVNRFNGSTTPLEMRVTSIDQLKDEVQYNGGDFVYDTMGNVVKNQRGAMDSPRQFYPSELYVGKRWTTMFRQTRERGTYNTFRYQLKVVGKESVTVPAGRFDAYKIEARGFNLQRKAALERDIWVAPGVDADVIHETRVRLANGMIEQYDRQDRSHFRSGRKASQSGAPCQALVHRLSHPRKRCMSSAHFDLAYYMWNELLVGSVGGESFVIPALSGGGRGGNGNAVSRKFTSFNPYIGTDEAKGVRGGSIPPGFWTVEKPSLYKPTMKKLSPPVAKLTPRSGQAKQYDEREYKNVPFLIHGPGGEGSNGCIIIEKVHRVRLLNAVENAGGAILLVTSTIREGDLLSKNLQLRRTA